MARKKELKKGPWSRDEIKLLKKRFPGRSTEVVAAELGRSYESVKKYASRLGMRKTKTYLRKIGR